VQWLLLGVRERWSSCGLNKGSCPRGRSLGGLAVTQKYDENGGRKRAALKEGRDELLDRRGALLCWGLLSFSLSLDTFNQTPAIAGSLLEDIDIIVGIFTKDGNEGNRVILSSGFKWDPDYIVTSYVAINDALKKNLNLMTYDRDGNLYGLVVHAFDPSLDIVVLRKKYDTSESGAPSIVDLKLGDEPIVGQNAYVRGINADGSSWIGSGIISATEREIQAVNGIKMKHLLQTDVPINPAAGGAGIFDSNGLLLGMMTSGNVPFKTSGYYDSGVHFVVAASTLLETVPALIRYKNTSTKL
jgi:S1-C subfamily serine protease